MHHLMPNLGDGTVRLARRGDFVWLVGKSEVRAFAERYRIGMSKEARASREVVMVKWCLVSGNDCEAEIAFAL